MAAVEPAHSLDTCGLLCPMPIIRLSAKIKEMGTGETVEILSDDMGILEDLPAWCAGHGHNLLKLEENDAGEYRGLVTKASR